MNTTPNSATHAAAAARTKERVGDGNSVTVEQFATMSYDERAELFTVNPDAYRNLAADK
ncbi:MULTISPECIES: hypothetical protein [Nocardioides]|uniref:Uncharacterized protein n=1 Tax=Nocardioides vastitatis TaxID=2568655 RepID=A0ABW0ZIV5_9ACTN|nr:hypothetical protein [Nocardioides sp.]